MRRTYWACVVLALLWALALTMLGFFFPAGITHIFDDVFHLVPALLFVAFLVGALSLGKEIGNDFKYVLGYGTIKSSSGKGCRSTVSGRGRRIVYASALIGLVAGCVAAAAIRVATEHWVGFLMLAGLAVLLLVPAIKVGHLAKIVWRQARTEQRIHRDIVASGEHSVGTVVAVTNEAFVVDNQALFHVEMEYETAGRMETISLRFYDYPIWAPAIGNEFDVWSDPERPFVEDRIVLERRYRGQNFARLADAPIAGEHTFEEPGELAKSGEPGDPHEELVSVDTARVQAEVGMLHMPQWMADEAHRPSTPEAARRTRFLIGIPPNLIAILSLLGTLLVPVMIDDVPWWTIAVLWVYTVLTIMNAAVYWQFILRRRWFLRSGVSFGGTEAAVFAGFFAACFAMVATQSMVLGPLSGEIGWTAAHVLTWAAVLGALLVFQWSFTSNAWALKPLNAEFPAPPEVIQEALTGHDPNGIDQLERDYGYRAGVFLCT